MRNIVLVLLLFIGSFTVQGQELSEVKAEDLSLLPSNDKQGFTLCSRITVGHLEQVWTENWEIYNWTHQQGGITVTDEISVGYAIVKCNAWEAHAKLTKSDD